MTWWIRDRPPRFEEITETTGIPLSPEGAEMMYTRYRLAADLAVGRRVLELGSGAGQGLALIGKSSRFVVGADLSQTLLRQARRHYRNRFPLVRLSADRLPFRNGRFDLAVCFEMSYYVPDMKGAFREIARVLAPAGMVVFVNANPERPDFIPSPLSVHYHTADEFRATLEALGFEVTVEGAFPVDQDRSMSAPAAMRRVLSGVRRALDVAGLVPNTLKGRARLKRLVYRKLLAVPAELSEGFATLGPRQALGPGPARAHKVLYVTAQKAR